MAYATTNPPALRSQRVGSTPGGADWSYASADALATVVGADYITDAEDLGMQVGDDVSVFDTNLAITSHTFVKSIDAAGAATLVAV